MSDSSDDTHRELVKAAIAALDRSHPANPPDRKFGAALITKAGNVYVSSAYWSETRRWPCTPNRPRSPTPPLTASAKWWPSPRCPQKTKMALNCAIPAESASS